MYLRSWGPENLTTRVGTGRRDEQLWYFQDYQIEAFSAIPIQGP
jgi:hypothetical protein